MCKVTLNASKQISFRTGELSIVGESVISHRPDESSGLVKVYQKEMIIADHAGIKSYDSEELSLLTDQIVLMSGGPCIITSVGPGYYMIVFTMETEGYIGNLQRFLESVRRRLNSCIDTAESEYKALKKRQQEEEDKAL